MKPQMKYKISLLSEIALYCVVVVWIFYLIADIKNNESVRSIFELLLLGLLVWWPIVRIRIQRGYWIRDFNDDRTIDLSKDRQPSRTVSGKLTDRRSS